MSLKLIKLILYVNRNRHFKHHDARVTAIPISFEVCITRQSDWTPNINVMHERDFSEFNSLRPSDAYMASVNYTIIGSDNGLSPGGRQAFIWTNAGILLTGPLVTNLSEILIAINTFSF